MKKKRVVIFGGAGFIGSYLTEALVKHGYTVVIFTRRSKKHYANLYKVSNKISFVRGNFYQTDIIKEVIKQNDIIFDLISDSVPSSSMQSPILEIKNNISSHLQSIEVLFKHRLNKFIFISSGGGVYGEKKKMPISEDENLQPSSPHAIGKVIIEYYLNYFARCYNIKYLIYRLSNPYGPRQTPKPGFGIIPTIIEHILLNKPPILFGAGKIVRDLIYIEDVIEAILSSFNRRTKHNVYNIASGKGVTLNQIWEVLKRLSKTDLKAVYKEKRVIDCQRVILDITRFSTEFSWRPKTSLQKGLKITLNSYGDYER